MEPNYFTCTLGQAAALGIQQPHKTANALVDALANDRPDSPAVGFPQPGQSPDDEWTSITFTFSDIRRGRDHVASTLLHDCRKNLPDGGTVALLCPSTPEFLFTWLALMRLGHAVLLIAPQCQPAAIASLCKTCEVSLLFYDTVYRDLAKEAGTVSENRLQVSSLPFPENAQRTTFLPSEREAIKLPDASVSEDDVAYLHHSSGTSSGMPKPIPQPHRAGVGVLPSFSNGHEAATFTTTPLYHGGIADLFRAWSSGAPIWLFPGKRVPITASNIVKCLDITQNEQRAGRSPPVKYFSSVPYVLQMMEADPRGLRFLQGMDIVGVGGAALPAEVGDRLVTNDVSLISRFGSAECGFLLSSHRIYTEDNDWQYLRVASGAEKYIRFEAQSSDDSQSLSELVVLPGWPHMAKRNREDGSFATSDLFAAHPSIPNAWRYHSRADSQLTLITGKKFDPAPLEATLATSELLDDVLIFGNGQPYPGALLFRSEEAKDRSDAELLEQVWPQVEKLNSESQDHTRVAKGMMVPMPVLEKTLEKSSKGTILRGAVEKRFAEEIEGAYEQVNGSSGGEDVPDEQLVEVVRHIVSSVVAGKGGKLSDDTNLFSYGVDSVAGMQIRGRLRRLLPASQPQLPINVVEDCGTVERLAEYVRRRRHGEAEGNDEGTEHDHKYMRQFVDEYSQFGNTQQMSEVTNGHNDATTGDAVVLTGATGALGAHVLDQYRGTDNVRKIYCLVRGSNEHAAFERVNKALIQRKLQALDSSGKDDRVVIMQAALGEPDLGLGKEMYERLAREATIIMHVAWSVNFRMKLRSFVKDNIAGVRSLIGLALASPREKAPMFAFCSSVASAMAYNATKSVPETIIGEPSAATELGYSQSKWVAEQICARAAESTRMKGRVAIYRVGQLAGDTMYGIWNMKEAWPMMLSAVKVTGSLPALEDEKLGWLPVNLAAKALIEGAEAPVAEGVAVYHVLNEHDRPTWMQMLEWLQRKEDFEILPPAEWVMRLEEATEGDGEKHSASQLLDHWRRGYVQEEDEKARDDKVMFAMDRTKEALPVLRDVQPVDEEYFGKLWSWIQGNM